MPFTLSPISVKDKDGASKAMVAYTDGTNNAFAHAMLDSTGALVNPATAANQATTNAALTNLDTNLGAKADTAATADGGTFSLIALLKRGLGTLAAIAASVAGATPAGANVIGRVGIDQTTPGTTNGVQLTAALPAGTSTIGSVSAASNSAGGVSTFLATALTNTPVAVKAGSASLYGVSFVNSGTAAAYVQLFDAGVGSVTLGTTAPKLSFWVPAGGAWEEKFSGEAKVAFATALTAAATTTATGNTAPAAGVLATVLFK